MQFEIIPGRKKRQHRKNPYHKLGSRQVKKIFLVGLRAFYTYFASDSCNGIHTLLGADKMCFYVFP
jgi:hypothetical protein